MGSMKEHWIETRHDCEVSFACPSCGRNVSASVRAPSVDGDMRSDATEEASEVLECLYCDTDWAVDLVATNEGLSATILDHPSAQVHLSTIDWSSDEHWEDYPEPEPEPHGIFEQAFKEWRVLLGTIGNEKSGSSSENRMLLVQLYAIVEAYLSDAIVGLALRDRVIRAKLISAIPSLSGKTVSLTTLAEKPEIVWDMVKSALQETSFHSLNNVDGICKRALGSSILPKEKINRDILISSVSLRHDCVHRNGRTKDGNLRDEITSQYLHKLGRLISGLAYDLDVRIGEIDLERRLSTMFGDQH